MRAPEGCRYSPSGLSFTEIDPDTLERLARKKGGQACQGTVEPGIPAGGRFDLDRDKAIPGFQQQVNLGPVMRAPVAWVVTQVPVVEVGTDLVEDPSLPQGSLLLR